MSEYEIHQDNGRNNFHVLTVVQDDAKLYVVIVGDDLDYHNGLTLTLVASSLDLPRNVVPISVSQTASRGDRLVIGRWSASTEGLPGAIEFNLQDTDQLLLTATATLSSQASPARDGNDQSSSS